MSYEITGTLVEKFETEHISEKFSKREFVLEVKPDNPNLTFTDMVKFQLTKDNCDLIDNINLGDGLTAHFNIRGRKWEKDGKVSYFTNLEAWRIENLEAGSSSSEPAPSNQTLPPTTEDDNLPF